ncbi:hypothetical protein SPRG_04485 [Saprolegnia parasitica CBS 223.65]|uniref:Uncharacterized protein n=1 Tax=Saprolegnia parasitica (strain CBS 223.65) TaxID=695850 RepID=A0A067CIM7_SAPPC|nr:hypothetical protein SPRG_04485 [Saprolegnia parasitica CBS 223.65]KDO30584.1 hypothetical protein SPRG_04485 [Saprolegnia parasitica CBS 223.65]|eukprot:XP_012198799.1 hypothetical protein SPRG_04485 [Saprolegnia parasitica CBS 223.65]
MQVGSQRVASARLDDVLHVDNDELPAIKPFGDLETLLVGKLSASGIFAYDAVFKLNCFNLENREELAPYITALDDDGLWWMLRTADVVTDDGSVPIFVRLLCSRIVKLKVRLDSLTGVVTEALMAKTSFATYPHR